MKHLASLVLISAGVTLIAVTAFDNSISDGQWAGYALIGLGLIAAAILNTFMPEPRSHMGTHHREQYSSYIKRRIFK